MWVFWVYASTAVRFEQSYREIAARVAIPGRNEPRADIMQLVDDWLKDERNGPWRMIVDNADKGETLRTQLSGASSRKLLSYLPKTNHGSILVTSRNRDVAVQLTGCLYKNVREIRAMDAGQALQLLRTKLGVNFSEDGADDLLAALNCIPLAVTQAAAYINRRAPRATISSYLDVLRKKGNRKGRVLTEHAADLGRDDEVHNSVIVTWQTSFEQIREERRSAADLLSLMSFFNPQGIPEWVLPRHTQCAAGVDAVRNAEGDDEQDDRMHDAEQAEDALEEDLHTLRAYSLLTRYEERKQGEILSMCEMHPLVQFGTQVWLSAVGDVERWRHKFFRLFLIALTLTRKTPHNRFKTESLLPHVELLFDYEPADKASLRSWALPVSACVRLVLDYGGRRQAAEAAQVKATKATETLLGPEDLDTLHCMDTLAYLRLCRGDYRESESMYRRILERREKALGKEHLDTLHSAEKVAEVLALRMKYEEAELIYWRVLKGRERILGEEHLHTLSLAPSLAAVFVSRLKNEEAKSMYRRILETELELSYDSLVIRGSAVHGLGKILCREGKYTEAEVMASREAEAYAHQELEGVGWKICYAFMSVVLVSRGISKEAEAMRRRDETESDGKMPNTMIGNSDEESLCEILLCQIQQSRHAI
jgi:tetratricopeptide (TPR) repeat protein